MDNTDRTQDATKVAFYFRDADALPPATCASIVDVLSLTSLGETPDSLQTTAGGVTALVDGLRIDIRHHYADMANAVARFRDPESAQAAPSADTEEQGCLVIVEVSASHAEDDAARMQGVQATMLARLVERIDATATPDAMTTNATTEWTVAAPVEPATVQDNAVTGPVRVQRPVVMRPSGQRPSRRAPGRALLPLSESRVSTRHRAPCRTQRHLAQHEFAVKEAMRAMLADADASGDEIEGQSLKAWTLTATCTIVAPPLGVALGCANLVAGASVRTASHMLAISGFFIAATSQGNLSQFFFGLGM